jgi:Flp pilus assembly pilin Flp
MAAVVALVNRLVVRDKGQDLIEYGLIVALIAVVAITGVTALGNVVNQVLWQTISSIVNGI